MRKVGVYVCGVYAGVLIQVSPVEYEFRYDEKYREDSALPALSLSMPKCQAVYRSNHLFPVFSNMLSEGANRKLQAAYLHVDKKDDFSILTETAQYDTIGAITIRPLEK